MERIAQFLQSTSERAIAAKFATLIILSLLAAFINWHEQTHTLY